MSGTGPASVLGQVGENLRVVNWVRDAWLEIQRKHAASDAIRPHWKFLWGHKEIETTTVVDGESASISLGSNVQSILPGTILVRKATEGDSAYETLPFFDYRSNAGLFRHGLRTDMGPPEMCTRNPLGALLIVPEPDQKYHFHMEIYQSPQTLVENLDVPLVAGEDQQMVIIYRALIAYAREEDAPEILAVAPSQYEEGMRALEWEFLDSPELIVARMM